jgi:hypothetical protein
LRPVLRTLADTNRLLAILPEVFGADGPAVSDHPEVVRSRFAPVLYQSTIHTIV